jgi:hypothetical protein
MSNTIEKSPEEVKSFHLADSKESFHLAGKGHGDKDKTAATTSDGTSDEVKSFHLAGSEKSFKKA